MNFNKNWRLGAAGLALVSLTAMSGCGGFGTGDSRGSGVGGDGADRSISFTTWGAAAEKESFKRLVAQFEEENDATVELNLVPYERMFSNIDAQMSAGNAPDVFRVDYVNLGVYSSQKQLLDLSPYVTDEEASSFTPAMWEAVSNEGTPYGVPHQTDVTALVLNLDKMEAAGVDVSNLPKTQEEAWTWEEFGELSAELRKGLPEQEYPFVYGWQLGGTPRWLSWLFQAGGALMDENEVPQINSTEGTRALNFTRGFFEKGWVPPNSSVKNTTYAGTLFLEGTAAMGFLGSFEVPAVDETADFEWTVVPMPVDERGATDLGGNALVAIEATDQPELAADFLEFMASAEAMEQFCAATNELPTRTDIDPNDIDFAVRPDIMPVFVEQASTIEPEDVRQLTSPAMAKISVSLQDELESAFVGGQSTEDTLAGIATAVENSTDR